MNRKLGFVSKRGRPPARVEWRLSAVAVGLAVALASVVYWHHPDHGTATEAEAYDRFRITATASQWNGDPVYRVENLADQTLPDVVIESWSNHLLPIYAVGPSTRDGLPLSSSELWPKLPIEVRPKDSVWFVGTAVATRPYTVMWLSNGSETYQTFQLTPPASE